MIAVVQRIAEGAITADGVKTGACGQGLLILLGVAREDTEADVRLLCDKIARLRIFEDENGRMNRSVIDVCGTVATVSNFTLLADYRRGNRPDLFGAAPPEVAFPLYDRFCELLEAQVGRGIRGVFGADMQIATALAGPVTVVLDSRVLKKERNP